MSTRDISMLLDDMLESVIIIRQYLQGVTESAFQANRMIQDAVVRRLEILGEAANQVPTDYCAQHPEIPWSLVTGMRNRLVHGYFLVDWDIVWRTIQTEVPALEAPLRTLRQRQP